MNDTNDAGTTAGAAPAANSNAEAETAARVAALEAELADHKDRLLRALAEVENIRRRAERERAEAVKYAVTGFAKDLLAVADNLRRALDSMPEAEIADGRTRSLLDGVAATERELLAAFERHGLRRFDHNLHEAVFEAERPDQPGGIVVEVLQPGYVLHDRLLRPAMVGVSKRSPEAAADLPASPAEPL